MTRINRSKEVHGLMKLPDVVIIKNLKLENGKLKAYITELEDKIIELQKKAKGSSQMESGSVEALQNTIKQLKKQNQRYRDIINKKHNKHE